jgi:hypothetical protein
MSKKFNKEIHSKGREVIKHVIIGTSITPQQTMYSQQSKCFGSKYNNAAWLFQCEPSKG